MTGMGAREEHVLGGAGSAEQLEDLRKSRGTLGEPRH